MSALWKRAWISVEVATRAATPIVHPVAERAHLEPAMTPTHAARQIERDQRDVELGELQWQEERERQSKPRPAFASRVEAVDGPAPTRERERR